MASSAPMFANPGIAKPGWKALPGKTMGGGCQANAGAVVYAQAVPPYRNAGGRAGFEQRAYFSAWSMVFEVPSVIKLMAIFPCGSLLYGVVMRSVLACKKALAA